MNLKNLKKDYTAIYKDHRLVAETNFPKMLQKKWGFSKERASTVALAVTGIMAPVYLAVAAATLVTAAVAAAQIAAAMMTVLPALGFVLAAATLGFGLCVSPLLVASGLGLGRGPAGRARDSVMKLFGKTPAKKETAPVTTPVAPSPVAAPTLVPASATPATDFKAATEDKKPEAVLPPPPPAPPKADLTP